MYFLHSFKIQYIIRTLSGKCSCKTKTVLWLERRIFNGRVRALAVMIQLILRRFLRLCYDFVMRCREGST